MCPHGFHRDFTIEPSLLWDVGWRRLLVGYRAIVGAETSVTTSSLCHITSKKGKGLDCTSAEASISQFPVNLMVVLIVLLRPCDWSLTERLLCEVLAHTSDDYVLYVIVYV